MLRIDTTLLAISIKSRLKRALQRVLTGNIISDALLYTTRNHVLARYPGSSHWSPSKITNGTSTSNSGSVVVDIAGANRAYQDIVILPKRAKYLTIPIHAMAYGKKAADIDGLFKPKNKNILAKVMNGLLVAVFALAKKAFLRQDKSLLPSNETFADNISARWVRAFFSSMLS